MPVLMRENTMIGNLAIKPGERESVSVTGDGEKTIQTLLYELAQKIDISKVNYDSYFKFATLCFRLNSISTGTTSSGPYFMLNFQLSDIGYSNKIKLFDVQISILSEKSCEWDEKSINYTLDPASVSVEEKSNDSEVLPSGYDLELYY